MKWEAEGRTPKTGLSRRLGWFCKRHVNIISLVVERRVKNCQVDYL